jgi:hypothetical protein
VPTRRSGSPLSLSLRRLRDDGGTRVRLHWHLSRRPDGLADPALWRHLATLTFLHVAALVGAGQICFALILGKQAGWHIGGPLLAVVLLGMGYLGMRLVLLVRAGMNLRAGLCPACGHDIRSGAPDEAGRAVCPECGARWLPGPAPTPPAGPTNEIGPAL